MATYTFSNYAALRAFPTTPNANDVAIVSYALSAGAGAGGGGEFYWESTASGPNFADNNGTIIKQGNQSNGRWLRIFSGAINVRWFGAKTLAQSAGFDSSTAIQAAINNALYNEVFIPAGEYLIGTTLDLSNKHNLKIIGEGKATILRTAATTIFLITSSTYDPVTFKNAVIGNEIKDMTLKGDLAGNPLVPVANTEGIKLYGASNGIIERVYYSGLDKVINQQQAESYIFRNITELNLEDRLSDCNYIIYSDCGTEGNYRSNDNIYTEIVGAAIKSEIYLDRSAPLGIPGKGFHDGASISECILFACADNNILITIATETTITSNKLFAAGKEAINLFSPVYCSITGNLISTPGNNDTTSYSGILISSLAGTPLFGSVTITGNVIERPTGNGIDITVCDGITIADNIIISPGETQRFSNRSPFTYSGINIKNSKNFNITRNVCTPYYDNVPPPGTAKYYPVDWKADVELDSKCYGSVLHDTTYQSRGVLNNSSNVLSYSGYADYEEIEFIDASQITTQISGYTMNTWAGTNASLYDDTMQPINSKFLPAFGNKSIMVNFLDSTSVSTYIESGTGTYLPSEQYATFSVWAISPSATLQNPSILILQIFKNLSNLDPSIKQIYVDATWRRYFVTVKQDVNVTNILPKVRIVSAKQPAMTIYFSPAQVTYTKKPLPTLYRTAFGTGAPTSGYWYKGDSIINNSPDVLGVAPNEYVIEKWLCTASGLVGTWKELRRNV